MVVPNSFHSVDQQHSPPLSLLVHPTFKQVYAYSSNTNSHNSKAMEELPVELRLQVLSHASVPDLVLRWGTVSRSWNKLANDDHLWTRHLDEQHPKWRAIMGFMGIDLGTTPRRQCFRLLLPHDPKEKRMGCCRHRQWRGAACLCCTCRRYHSDQQWDVGDSKEDVWDDMLAVSYDAYTRTYNSLVTTNEEDLDVISFYRDQSFQFDMLLKEGLLEIRGTFDDETVAWTAEAHRTLRPPLRDWQYLLRYSDARLYKALMRKHPELCDNTVLDRYGELLDWFSAEPRIVREVYAEASGSWTRETFHEALTALLKAGWLHREGTSTAVAWTYPTIYLRSHRNPMMEE